MYVCVFDKQMTEKQMEATPYRRLEQPDVRACGAKLRSGGRQLLLESTWLGKSLESN